MGLNGWKATVWDLPEQPYRKALLFWFLLATQCCLKPCTTEAFGILPKQKGTGVLPKLLGRIPLSLCFMHTSTMYPEHHGSKAKSVCESERWLTPKSDGSRLDLPEKKGWKQGLVSSPLTSSSDKEGVTTKGQHFLNCFVMLFLRSSALLSLWPHSDIWNKQIYEVVVVKMALRFCKWQSTGECPAMTSF